MNEKAEAGNPLAETPEIDDWRLLPAPRGGVKFWILVEDRFGSYAVGPCKYDLLGALVRADEKETLISKRITITHWSPA